jgi:hypothetical protein
MFAPMKLLPLLPLGAALAALAACAHPATIGTPTAADTRS